MPSLWYPDQMCNNGLVVGMVKDMRRLEVVTGIGMDRCGKHLTTF